MIKTKNQALDYLKELINVLEEQKMFASRNELSYLKICQQNLIRMSNSIRNSESFFDSFFKDKDKEEVKQWIENEAKEW